MFPFDPVCREIVLALHERDWEVPGVNVQFLSFGSMRGWLKLWEMRTLNCLLRFSRQGSAAVGEIVTPFGHLIVDDPSRVFFYKYVGRDWRNHRKDFLYRVKIWSRELERPRTYLMYVGKGQYPTFLNHTNFRGKEYDRSNAPEEPERFETQEVMDDFREYLEGLLLWIKRVSPSK